MWLFALQKTVNCGLKDGFLQANLPCFVKQAILCLIHRLFILSNR